MSKHTPGPWKVCHYSHINKEQWLGILNGAFDITHNGASNPAVVACSKYSAMTDEENLANATLIAAAPDLLEALEFIAGAMAAGETLDNTVDRVWIEKVISKAKGE